MLSDEIRDQPFQLLSLSAAAQHVDQNDAWRTHRTIFGINWEGTTNGSEQKRALDQTRTLAYVQYRAADVGDSETDLTFSLSWHQQDEEQERIRSDGRSDIQGMDLGTLGLWGQFDMPSRFRRSFWPQVALASFTATASTRTAPTSMPMVQCAASPSRDRSRTTPPIRRSPGSCRTRCRCPAIRS